MRVAVVGATGVVGRTILDVMSERSFPADEVVAFASARTAGQEVPFRDGASLTVQELRAEALDGFDLALFSAGGSTSEEWAPRFVDAGATVVDNSSYWRMHDDVPLVVSEVNPNALDGAVRGIVANPNCSTMQMVVPLRPILDAAGIERLVISTYQSVSGTGKDAVDELTAQTRAHSLGEDFPRPRVYPHQIAFNVIPQVETFKDGDDYTTEERKMMGETRKILGAPELPISATCARVPVYHGHSESINVQTREDLSPEAARDLLHEAAGVVVVDDPWQGLYPLATAAAGRDDVLVGRVRRDPSHERCLNLWVVGDNLRKGAATNAVQVAELVVERGLLGRGAVRAA
ncbi:MAG: Aspartate-semialdehyde dehydrogenase [uncultured Solirubrobacterales bacterium]|uniref:Aspartate-semialdehyde dehydrogenase n=1 Tax=uncultured Solirubrobacterales bacterium TaxID=768556 RepID=A0A6J4T708_9ACTN|nr:MAG: Aspartate-semialdehyde dehydrogenase [uncultured Solirubrobacterales bacterium]